MKGKWLFVSLLASIAWTCATVALITPFWVDSTNYGYGLVSGGLKGPNPTYNQVSDCSGSLVVGVVCTRVWRALRCKQMGLSVIFFRVTSLTPTITKLVVALASALECLAGFG